MIMLDLAIVTLRGEPDADALNFGESDVHWCAGESKLLTYGRGSGNAGAEIHALELKATLPGASAGALPTHHYVVWTDIAEGWEEELDAWYAGEHMPGLASVPGTVRARRFRCVDGRGPRSFAAYDLVGPDVLGSSPWLAVRGTEWSSRVRPQFRNTRRWMCRTLRHDALWC